MYAMYFGSLSLILFSEPWYIAKYGEAGGQPELQDSKTLSQSKTNKKVHSVNLWNASDDHRIF
jgi:hypothetical protein